jgi:CRP/FNR family transcriptional regulator, cyclic AMP receptor protein
MFIISEADELFELGRAVAHELTNKIEKVSGLVPHSISLKTDEPLLLPEEPKSELIIIREGVARIERHNRLQCFAERDDVLYTNSPLLQEARGVAECALKCDLYPFAAFDSQVQRDSDLKAVWDKYSLAQLFLSNAASHQAPRDGEHAPERRYFSQGAGIIIQGTTPKEVYLLVRGRAEVYYGATKVGEVRQGEIFGALAAINYPERSASVLASMFCVVAVFPKEQFLRLLQSHPRTVLKLVEDMARVILSQNERIEELSEKGPQH